MILEVWICALVTLWGVAAVLVVGQSVFEATRDDPWRRRRNL